MKKNQNKKVRELADKAWEDVQYARSLTPSSEYFQNAWKRADASQKQYDSAVAPAKWRDAQLNRKGHE